MKVAYLIHIDCREETYLTAGDGFINVRSGHINGCREGDMREQPVLACRFGLAARA